MKRFFLPLCLAFLALTSCDSEQEKKDKVLAQKIDDSIELSGNEYGQVKLILKGPLLDTALTVEGNESFNVVYNTKSKLVSGVVASKDGSIEIEFGFSGTDLGYRSVSAEDNYAISDLEIGEFSMQDVAIEKAKVAVRRARPGDFAVGSYTGVIMIEGKTHTYRIEFETALKQLPEEEG